MSTAAHSLPDAGAGIDRYVPRFLLWLQERTGGATGVPVRCAEFGARQSVPGGVVHAVVERLRAHAMIRVHSGPGAEEPVVSFEPAGADQARWLQARRADPAERGRHARKALLAWIFAQSDRRPLRIEEFFDSGEIFFLGESLTRGEVARTAAYLSDTELITCEGPPFHGRIRSHVSLTPLGVDAVLTGADVGRYVEEHREQARPTTGPVFHGPVHGYANRDLTVRGDVTVQPALTPAELADLLRQFAPVLAVDEASRTALAEAADALDAEDDAEAGSLTEDGDDDGDDDGEDGDADPRPGRRQGVLERVRTVLHASPDTIGRQVVLDAVGQAMGRLLG